VVQRGPDDWVFQIPRGKWKTDTENVPIIDLVQPIVARMLESPGPWLIPQQAPFPVDYKKPFPIQRWYKNKWEAACRAAGLPVGKRHGPEGEVTYGFTWHCARHAFAENLINEGASGKIAQRAGRWSSEAMLDRYGKTEDLLPVREAMIRGAQRWKRMYGGTAVQATKPVFDEERFRQDHPALYAQYVKMIPAEPFSSGTSLGPEGGGEPGGNTQPIDN
jgi:integrase